MPKESESPALRMAEALEKAKKEAPVETKVEITVDNDGIIQIQRKL